MVSIIMGVFNGEKTLSQAIESLLSQTYIKWELIICDDCSLDNSFSIMKSYMLKDDRIRVIQNKKNMGLAASLNRCIKHVRGEFIARMDCDDIAAPNRLERQVEYLRIHSEIDLVGTFMQAFDENGLQHIIKTKEQPTKYDLPKGAPFAHATILVRTDVLKKLNGYSISRHTVRTEDVDLWYRFFAAGFVGVNIPEVLYFVRIDENAYRRRKLKYMLHASYIIWYGCDLINLPIWYKLYCAKPIISWILPHNIKEKLRKYIIR